MYRDFYEDYVSEEEEKKKNSKEEEDDEYNENEFVNYNEEDDIKNKESNNDNKEEEEEYNDNEFNDYNEKIKNDEENIVDLVNKKEEVDTKEQKKEEVAQFNNNNKENTYVISPIFIKPDTISRPKQITKYSTPNLTYNKVNEIMKNDNNQFMSKTPNLYYNEKNDILGIKQKVITTNQSIHINPLYLPRRTSRDSKLNKLLKNYYADYRKLMKNNTSLYQQQKKKDETDYYPTISPLDFTKKKKKIAKMLCHWNEDYDFTLLLLNDNVDIVYSNESSLFDNNIDNILVRNDFGERINRMIEVPYVKENNNCNHNLYQIKENDSKYEDEYQSLDKKAHNKTTSLPKDIKTIQIEENDIKEDNIQNVSEDNIIEEDVKNTINNNKVKTTIQNTKKSKETDSLTIKQDEDNDEAIRLYEQFEYNTLSHYLKSNKYIIC